MKVLEEGSPLLGEVMPEFKFENGDAEALAGLLTEHCKELNALGLAANQLGIRARVFVMGSEPSVVCFNPKIVSQSEEQVQLPEGCLSFPNLWIKIKRPESIRVRYQDVSGNTVTQVLSGYNARCFQHELDHLNGIVYTAHADRFHLDQARRKQKRQRRQHG